MKKDTRIEGMISGLERTTHVSGGGETRTTTQHIAIFRLSGERVILMINEPAMIDDGDVLRVVGQPGQGQFTAIACKNLTTGWTSKSKGNGCAKIALMLFAAIAVGLTCFLPIFFFMPIIVCYALIRIIRADARIKKAHLLLEV